MFKQILAVFAISLVLVSQAAAQQSGAPAPNTATVRKHTGLKFATLQPLSSTTSKVGDDVPLRLVNPLVVDGVTLLPAGEIVHGKVVKVKKADLKCHDGQVNWQLNQITFADASTARVQVWSVVADPEASVPGRLVHQSTGGEGDFEINNWWEAILAIPMYALMIVAYSPLLLVLPLALFSSCDLAGKEFNMPANSTVAVEVRQNHKVRY